MFFEVFKWYINGDMELFDNFFFLIDVKLSLFFFIEIKNIFYVSIKVYFVYLLSNVIVYFIGGLSYYGLNFFDLVCGLRLLGSFILNFFYLCVFVLSLYFYISIFN